MLALLKIFSHLYGGLTIRFDVHCFFIQLLEHYQAVTVVVVVTGTDRNQCSTGKPVKETQSILFPLSATVPVSNSFIRSDFTQS